MNNQLESGHDLITSRAAAYGRAGLRVFPVNAEAKDPSKGYAWLERATSYVSDIVQDFTEAVLLWGEDGVSVAWACGLDGYVAIDLDVACPPLWWAHLLPHAVVNTTRRGQHLVFQSPEGMTPGNGASKFPSKGWGEVRGVHGYIVIDGPDRPGLDAETLVRAVPFPRPEWLTEASELVAPAVTAAEVDAFNRQYTGAIQRSKLDGIAVKLDARRLRGDDGKYPPRHPAAVEFACWIAREAAAGLFPASEGWALLDGYWREVMVAEPRRLNGRELSAIKAWAIAQAMADPQRIAEVRAEALTFTGQSPADAGDGGGLRLPQIPAWVYEARPMLTRVRQAAHSRGRSADAVLGAVLARIAVCIPRQFVLPAVVGSTATFDFLAGVAAPSGYGKSDVLDIAAELLPIGDDQVRCDLPVGSGEGLIEALFEWQTTPDPTTNKPTRNKVQRWQAIHLAIDEGRMLLDLGARSGSTLIPALCSLWGGRVTGHLNASEDTRRILAARQARFSAVFSMQIDKAPATVLNDSAIASGLPQRVVWFATTDASVPRRIEDRPAWPGVLSVRFERWHTEALGQQFRLAPAVANEIVDSDWLRTSGTARVAELETHRNLARLKVAGMLAWVENRQPPVRNTISEDDWRIAGAIIDNSVAVRAVMERRKDDLAASSTRNAVERAVTIDNARADNADNRTVQAIEDCATWLARKVWEAPDDTVVAASDLRRLLSTQRLRDVWKDDEGNLLAPEVAAGRRWIVISERITRGQRDNAIEFRRGDVEPR